MTDQNSDLLSKYGVSVSGDSGVETPTTVEKPPSLLSKYGVDEPAVTEPKVSTLGTYGETIAQAVRQTPAYIASAIEGKTPYSEQGKIDETIEKAAKEQEAFQKAPGAKSEILGGLAEAGEVREQAPSVASSLAGMAPTAAGAAIGTAIMPGVGTAVGAGLGGILGYVGMKRAAENQLVRNYVAKEEAAKGRPLSQPEKLAAQEKALGTGEVEKYGMAEAGGELAGQAAEGLIALTPAGKILKTATSLVPSRLGKAAAVGAGKALGITGTEIATESGTQMFQQPVESKLGFTDEAPRELTSPSDWATSVKEVAKPTALAVLPMAGIGGISGGVQEYRSTAPKPEVETEQPATEATQPATEATQPATSELDLRTDAEKAAKPIDLTTPEEDFGEVEQPTERSPINVPPEAEPVAPDVNRLSDFVSKYEARFAEGGIPTMVGRNLRGAAISAGTYDRKDPPDIVFTKLKAAVEAMKTPEQKIAEAATTAAETSNAEILSAYPDGNPGIVGKVAVEANNAGISSVAQEAAAAKEQDLAAQQEQVVVDTTTGEVLPAEAPVPASDIDVEAIRNIKDDNMLRNWLAKSEKLPELRAVIQTELDKRAAAVQPQPEVADAPAQPETGPLYGGGSEQPSVRGEGERAAVSGEGVPPEGQAIGYIPTAEDVITQPEPIGEANGESTNQAAQTTPQEVTPELDAAVANQAAANSSPDDYVPTDSFEDAAAVTLSEQSDKAPEDIAEGKYKKGEVAYKGLRVAIETPAGESRVNKKDPASPYPPLDDHYGEIVGAVAIDGDFVDAFSNPDEAAREASKQVFIVDQIRPTQEGVAIDKTDPHTWEYDEAKVMLGYGSKAEAEKAYLRNYEPGWQGLGEISAMSLPNFKRWLVSGKTKEPVAKKVAAPKMESAPKVPVFKVPLRGKVSEPDKRVYRLVADRLGIPTSVVADIDRLSASELQSRNQEGIYPLNSARISEYGGDLRDRYVEYVRLFNPEELTTSEAEDGIKTRQGSNYPQYLAWAKKGVKPPLISVAETESGAFQSSSRRRTLAAQEAGKPISGWFSPINRETTYKDPLKYGDILDAIQDVKDDTRTKTVQKTDDLLTAIAKLGGIARKHAEGVDPAAFKDAKAKGDITPVFRVTGGRSLDDLMLVLNTEYGWAFADPNDLGMAVTDALRSGEPVYNAEGSERQAKKQLDEYKSDDQLQAEFEFLADVDAADIPEADKEAFKADILDGDFDPERDRKILDNLIAKYAPAFSRRAAPGQTDLFATTKEEMAELNAKQGVADYAAQKDKRRQGNGAEPPPLFSDYPGFMGQVDIEDKEQSLPDLFQSLGKFDKAPETINHPDAERIRYVQDNFLDLLTELESNKKVEIKC